MNGCMRVPLHGPFQFLVFAVLAVACAGCATSGRPRQDAASAPGQFPEVTYRQDASLMGVTVRQLGEQCGGGLALVNGLEGIPVGPLKLRDFAYEALVQHLAAEWGLAFLATPHYFLLYPPEYKALESLSVATALPSRYHDIRTTCSFGSGTALYNVLGVLGTNLGLALVADNVVAEVKCGELFLTEAPLPAVLDAILQSARMSPQALVVECSDEYIFFRSRSNQSAPDNLLNPDALSPEQGRLLEKQVSICLPERPESGTQIVVCRAAMTLKAALPALAAQLGCDVRAAAGLEELPVNFTVMNRVRLQSALELLIRQWPIAEFGYEVTADGIVIRRR